jgi:hypothetical protein
MEKKRNVRSVLVRKREEKRPLGVDWVEVFQGTDEWMCLANTLMNLRVP